eukprot:5519663-Heterocapsa_arctica.AAC.1
MGAGNRIQRGEKPTRQTTVGDEGNGFLKTFGGGVSVQQPDKEERPPSACLADVKRSRCSWKGSRLRTTGRHVVPGWTHVEQVVVGLLYGQYRQ